MHFGPTINRVSLREIAQYALRLVNGWLSVQAEREDHNNAGDIALPVFPQQLVTLRKGDCIASVLDVYCGHVGLNWVADDVDYIKTDHLGLLNVYYNHELTTEALIDGQCLKTNLNDDRRSLST